MSISTVRIPEILWPDVPRDIQELVGTTLIEEAETYNKHGVTSRTARLVAHSDRMEGMVFALHSAVQTLGLPVADPRIIPGPWEKIHQEQQAWIWYTLLHEISNLVKGSEFCKSPKVDIQIVATRLTLAASAYRAAAVALGYAPGFV